MKYYIAQITTDTTSAAQRFTLEITTAGTQGLSAYHQWLVEGNTGTWEEFYESLRGPIGLTGFVDPDLQTLHDNAVAAAGQAALDRIQTGEDRTQTGLDVVATGADREATGLDATATAADRVQTGEDRIAAANSATAAQTAQGLAETAQTASETARTAAESARDDAVAVVSTASLTPEPGKIPIADANGKISAGWINAPIDDAVYQLGQPGELGFGCATAYPHQYSAAGCVPLAGHEVVSSVNYGNYLHLASGAIMVWIPKHYYKITGNLFEYSDVEATGYVIDRSFINSGAEIEGVMVSKYGGTLNDGKFSSQPWRDPMSTNSAHNPISQVGAVNNYGGLYTAVKTMDANAVLTPIFVYSMLARMAKAHGEAATSTSVCAYIDVDPKMPKGCLVSALRDVNDSSVTYTGSGYSACGLTGSGRPFAKTTHNGQDCGIADLNGNMWEVASGFIRTDSTGFLVLSESTDLTAIANDSTTQGAGGAYDIDLYDVIDISDLVSGNDGWIDLGNGSNQVFGFSTARTDAAYKRTAIGIPRADGVSGGGTTEFGNDGIYRYLRDDMACLCGGYWHYSSIAGVFAMTLYYYRTASSYHVGGRASILV